MAMENQQSERTAAVPPSVCSCGKEFQPYQHGATFVKKLCRECLVNKINRKPAVQQQKQKAEAASPGPAPPIHSGSDVVQLAFSQSDEGLLKRIRKLSLLERRTVEAQILYWLERNVPELKANGG